MADTLLRRGRQPAGYLSAESYLPALLQNPDMGKNRY